MRQLLGAMFPWSRFGGIVLTVGVRNESKAQEAGNIVYWPDRMIIAIFYGKPEGVGLTNVFGKVTGDLDALCRAGEIVWKEQGAELRIEHRLRA